ncbi:MAG TPA: type IV pilus twitching motility protein PilT [Candidatus Brocadiia bacterium]|nr:type IV pilus twitching motility protein PilT [Candidatus Brocadiia bacterium]
MAKEAYLDIVQILQFAVERNASDVLLTANCPPTVRINGELIHTNAPAMTAEFVKKLVYSVLDDEQIAAFESKKELDFSLYVENKSRFRGNVFMQRGCVGAAFRTIPGRIPNIRELGLPEMLADLALKPQGLLLVTGPTGHGKSTTLAAMLDIINTIRKCHIVTVEDPIEFIHTNKKSIIDQREVGSDTKSFANALKHVLRQDPDVILVGEMRDLETIGAALRAAETGHLVLATLHTNDAVQTIDRLIDVFPAHQQQQIRIQLAFCLLAVFSQRLIPRLDTKGRICASEIMLNNHAIAHLIRDAKTFNIYSTLETQAKVGMYTMDSSLKQLYEKGLVSYENAKMWMKNPMMLDSPSRGKRKE